MNSIIHISYSDLLVSTVLVLIAGLLSLVLKLKLEKRLLWASCRTVVQLLMVGYILKYIFRLNNEWMVFAVLLLMIVLAAHAAIQRASSYYVGVYVRSLGSLVLVSFFTLFVVTQIVIQVDPWYSPQYLIPLMGMISGNSITGISLSLDRFLEHLSERKGEIELFLSMGASRWEAARKALRDSIRVGLIPIINIMTVAGIVSLPGAMTGQILAGVSPLLAVKYQILVMFMIASATSLGSVLVALLTYRHLFNSKHQLCDERIYKRS
jgi:putative ABC transport system permease protein